MTNHNPQLGDKVKDKVSGFTGIVTGHAEHIAGCDRLWIEPSVGADNKLNNGQWIDIDMVEIIEAGAIERVTYSRAAPGGNDLPPSR